MCAFHKSNKKQNSQLHIGKKLVTFSSFTFYFLRNLQYFAQNLT